VENNRRILEEVKDKLVLLRLVLLRLVLLRLVESRRVGRLIFRMRALTQERQLNCIHQNSLALGISEPGRRNSSSTPGMRPPAVLDLVTSLVKCVEKQPTPDLAILFGFLAKRWMRHGVGLLKSWVALMFPLSGGKTHPRMVGFLTAARAQTRTWVSGVGSDANPCSRIAPCQTFAGAISKTAAGGEINVLDPGGFGAVTITKSITPLRSH
jgi:hypothetical protein